MKHMWDTRPSYTDALKRPEWGEIACAVKDLLFASDLSSAELARRIHKDPKALLGWMHNTVHEFDFAMLARLCAIFTFTDRSGTLHPLPPSVILEWHVQPHTQEIGIVFTSDSSGYSRPLAIPARTVFQVSALERLPDPFNGRIVCHLQALMQRENLTYVQLAQELRSSGFRITDTTLSEIAHGSTVSIWRPTLLALCNRFGGISRLFSYTTPPVGSDH